MLYSSRYRRVAAEVPVLVAGVQPFVRLSSAYLGSLCLLFLFSALDLFLASLSAFGGLAPSVGLPFVLFGALLTLAFVAVLNAGILQILDVDRGP